MFLLVPHSTLHPLLSQIFPPSSSVPLYRPYSPPPSLLGSETAESLKTKVQALEGSTFVRAVELYRTGQVGPYSTVRSSPSEKKANTEVGGCGPTRC